MLHQILKRVGGTKAQNANSFHVFQSHVLWTALSKVTCDKGMGKKGTCLM